MAVLVFPGTAAADAPTLGYTFSNTLTSLNSGLCAAVGNNSTSPGMHLIQYKCDGKDNKRFHLLSAGTNKFFMKVKSSLGRTSHLCVAPRGSSTAEHAVLEQIQCANTDFQVWEAISLGNDSYRLRNFGSGLCMTVAWDQTYSGQPLDQASCGAFVAQAWRFTRV
jgi:hypothetical protein